MVELFIVTVLGGLAVAYIIAFLRRRRLRYVLPRLYDYSDLSAGSRTVELIILNLGRRVESNVKLELSPGFRYTVLAASKHGLSFSSDGVLRIERLTPKSEISLVFLAEGNTKFTSNDVAELSSDESTGKPADSVQQAQASGPSVALGVLVVMIAIWGLGKMVEKLYLPMIANSSVVTYFDEPIDRYDSCVAESRYSNSFRGSEYPSRVEEWISISKVWRRFSAVHVQLLVRNHFPEVAEIALVPSSIAAENASSWEYDWTKWALNELVEAGRERSLIISAHLPKDFLVQSFAVEYHISTPSNLRAWGELRIGIGSTKVSCSE